jgi:hypothetical protein
MSGKICNGLLSRWLFKVLDCLAVPLRLSNWIHGVVNVLDGGLLVVGGGVVTDAVSLFLMWTCPKGEIWEIVSIYAAAATQTYDHVSVRAAASDSTYGRLKVQGAAAMIHWISEGPRIILFEGQSIVLNVASSTGAGVYSLMRRRVTVG